MTSDIQPSSCILRIGDWRTETLKRGWAEMPSWVSCTEAGTRLDNSRVRKVFVTRLKAAGLPPHLTPHCLRHSFASLMVQQDESPAYVQRRLGHASIQLTVDTYRKWLPMGSKAAVDRLDDGSGSKGRPVARPPQKCRIRLEPGAGVEPATY